MDGCGRNVQHHGDFFASVTFQLEEREHGALLERHFVQGGIQQRAALSVQLTLGVRDAGWFGLLRDLTLFAE